jgi:hypothetical protein
VHGLVAEKAKHGKPSTSKGGPQHQDHVKMNVCILGYTMVVQRQNDQKVTSHVRVKAQCEWDKLLIITEQYSPLPKPTLVKLASKQLLQVLGLNVWGVGNVLRDVTSRMEKDENLQKMIRSTCFAYA